jgi:hypothetical protein
MVRRRQPTHHAGGMIVVVGIVVGYCLAHELILKQ